MSQRAWQSLVDLHQKNPEHWPQPWRIIDYFVHCLSPLSPPEILASAEDENTDIALLRPLGLGFEDAKELLLYIENNADAELSAESQSLLDFLQRQAAAAESGVAESKWGLVQNPSATLTFRASLSANDEFFVPTHRDLWPLEQSVLNLFPLIERWDAGMISAQRSSLIEGAPGPYFVRGDDEDRAGTSFSIADLPFMPWFTSNFFIVTEANGFVPQLHDIFTPAFGHALRAQNRALPDLVRESTDLQTFIAGFPDLPFYPRDFTGPTVSLREEIHFPQALLKKTLSPSALETYADCPMRYYLSRLAPWQSRRDDDLGDPDHLKRGQWLHAALEDFFKTPNWLTPATTPLLRTRIAETFGESISPAYRATLETEAELLGHVLDRHLNEFEKPLFEYFPRRTVSLEQAFRTALDEIGQGFALYGKVDRVDSLGENLYLIWDYKSGDTTGAPATQIKNAKFQWFLYKAIFEKLDPNARVLGGGYLNPLDAEKSSLFLFTRDAPADILLFLENLWTPLGHTTHRIDTKKEIEIVQLLTGQITQLAAGLTARDFSPQPRKENSCERCDVVALCGRPYLKSKNTSEVTS